MLTTGVAIAIPEPFGSQLRRKRAEFGDPMAETVPSHVTLMPPMQLERGDFAGICRILEGIADSIAPFPMRLEGTGTFRPVSPVVFISVSQGISESETLARHLRASLEIPGPEFPFHPHVTVAHHLDDESLDWAYDDLSDFTCEFQVESFHLYLHNDADGWCPKKEFRLGQKV